MKKFEYVKKSIERFVVIEVKKNGAGHIYEGKLDHLKEFIAYFGLDIEMLYQTFKAFKEKTLLSKGIMIVSINEDGGRCVNISTHKDFEFAVRASIQYVA